MGEFTVFDLVFSFALTWTLGLGLPLLLRFVVFKRPFKKWVAVTIAILWFIPNLFFWIALSVELEYETSSTHMVQYVMAYINYRILIKENKSEASEPTQSDQAET